MTTPNDPDWWRLDDEPDSKPVAWLPWGLITIFVFFFTYLIFVE